jgi:hypothetical protein
MATLIRLKQIESSSALQTAASTGTDFSASVFEIIDGAGLISSSNQVSLVSASGYNQLATDLEVSVISSSIAATIAIVATGTGFVTTASFNSYTESFSSSVTNRVSNLESFSSSLDQTFATDAEVFYTSSNIIDQGEW